MGMTSKRDGVHLVSRREERSEDGTVLLILVDGRIDGVMVEQ
jgi:hypothetical protein